MNKKNILLFLTILVSSIHSTAQINVNFDDDCLNRNSAILANAMIQAVGPDTLMKFLDNKSKFAIVCNIDTFGRVLEIVRTFQVRDASDESLRKIEAFLVCEKVHFFICIDNNPPVVEKSVNVNYIRSIFKEYSYRYIFSVGFPGELMFDYEYDQEKKENGGVKLSKYDYLLTQIKRYLPSKK